MVIRSAPKAPPPKTATLPTTKTTAAATATLRLDDVLDFLQSNDGASTLQGIKADLQKAGVEFNDRHGPTFGGAEPTDTFEGLVNHALVGSFLRSSQATVAIANAAIYAFAHAADDNGLVDGKLVAQRLGPKANALFTQLKDKLGALPGGPPPSTRLKTKYAWLPKEVVTQVARSAQRSDLIERMPVLEEVTRLLGGKTKLAGLQMMAVQHLFPTTQTLFEELQKNGLDPKKTVVHGKNYSTNQDIMYRMGADGWNVPGLSQTKLLINNPDGTSRELNPIPGYLQKMLDGVDPAEKGPKFLLLDEGGKIVKALHDHFPQYAHLCVAVEQTDRGLQILDEMKAKGQELLCPVINVARSVAKKQNESPMIGESVVHSTETALAALHADLQPRLSPEGKKEAVVVGYGAVGKAVSDALRRRGFQVFVHDIDPEKMAQAQRDGCTPGTREETLKHGHLLYSCTGRTTMKPDEFDKLLPDKAILVNAASGNHEIGMDAIDVGGAFLKPGETADELGWRRDTFDGKSLRLGDIAGLDEMASCVVRGEGGSERLIVRSGYVVNMTDDIPPEYIQLTRSLLLAACLQAAESHGQTGLVTLDEDAQQLIVARTKKHLIAEGHDLLSPDFRSLAPAET